MDIPANLYRSNRYCQDNGQDNDVIVGTIFATSNVWKCLNWMQFHLKNNHLEASSMQLVMTCCNRSASYGLQQQKTWQSSAKQCESSPCAFIISFRSLVYNITIRGHRTDSCYTPNLSGASDDLVPDASTDCVLPDRQDESYGSTVPRISNLLSSLRSKISWSVVSKALLMSSSASNAILRDSIADVNRRRSSAVTVQ